MLNKKSAFGGSDITIPSLKSFAFLVLVMLFSVFAANNLFSQDKDKIKDGINKVFEMFNKGDLTGVEKYIDGGYIEHTLAPGQKEGLDGFKEMMESFKKAFPDIKFTINDIIISDNKAAVLSTINGTNTGEFMGMPATNKKVTIMGIDWLV